MEGTLRAITGADTTFAYLYMKPSVFFYTDRENVASNDSRWLKNGYGDNVQRLR